MGQFAKEVKELVEQNFEGAPIDIEETPTGRVVGSIVGEGFNTMDQADCQQTVHEYLRQQIGERMVQIGVLLMYTPHELELMQAA